MLYVCLPSTIMAAQNRLHLRGEDDLKDSSGNQYHGREVGGVVGFDRGFVDGRAFRFDGRGSHIAVDHGGRIDLRSSFTLTFWIKPALGAVNGVILAEGIVDHRPSGRTVYLDSDRENGDGLVTYDDTAIDKLRSRTPINDGGWHHVGIAIDYDCVAERGPIGISPFLENHRIVQGRARIYIDGLPDADSGADSGLKLFRLLQSLNDTLTTGGTPARYPDLNLDNPAAEHNAFRGLLDDVQNLEGALSEEQVFQISEAEIKTPIVCTADDTQALRVTVE